MFEHFTQFRSTSNGVGIHAVVGGSGPPLLMLHGFLQNLAMWARVAPELAAAHTVVCADLRGYGNSDKPAALRDLSNYSFRVMADDQVALMLDLGFERFDVVGHDRGGRTAYRMALDRPDVVRSVAILDIVPTDVMFERVDRHVVCAYWHWYFLQQRAPYPERVIACDPDHFCEGCLTGWGPPASRTSIPRSSRLAGARGVPKVRSSAAAPTTAPRRWLTWNWTSRIATVSSTVRRSWCGAATGSWDVCLTCMRSGRHDLPTCRRRRLQADTSSSINSPSRPRGC
jgi:pimeloyl-ACP methyl ester carboxylesterase